MLKVGRGWRLSPMGYRGMAAANPASLHPHHANQPAQRQLPLRTARPRRWFCWKGV